MFGVLNRQRLDNSANYAEYKSVMKNKSRPVNIIKYAAIGSAIFLAACTSVGERTLVSVAYYTVNGETFSEVDKQIKIHGPEVTGVGKALASTDLQMLPSIKYELADGGCKVSNARINVKARVTLPRHANVNTLKAELAKAWNSLEEYARVHEAVHLAIADRYAIAMEKAINSLPPAQDCVSMREDVQVVFSDLFEKHHADQLQFDADEKERIRGLVQKRNASIPRETVTEIQ